MAEEVQEPSQADTATSRSEAQRDLRPDGQRDAPDDLRRDEISPLAFAPAGTDDAQVPIAANDEHPDEEDPCSNDDEQHYDDEGAADVDLVEEELEDGEGEEDISEEDGLLSLLDAQLSVDEILDELGAPAQRIMDAQADLCALQCRMAHQRDPASTASLRAQSKPTRSQAP